MEQELATYLYEEFENTFPVPPGETSPPIPSEVEAEKMKSYLAEATAIVKFLHNHGLV